MTDSNWLAIDDVATGVHILPVDDALLHEFTSCPCLPEVEEVNETVQLSSWEGPVRFVDVHSHIINHNRWSD